MLNKWRCGAMVRFHSRLFSGCALFGGVLLLAIMVMVSVSVVGRSLIDLGLDSVAGDYELVEMAMAVIIFSFLPYCQHTMGHVRVAVLDHYLPGWINRTVDHISNVFMLLFAAFVCWRLGAGMVEKYHYHESSFILQIPYWVAYALCLPAAALWLASCALTILSREPRD